MTVIWSGITEEGAIVPVQVDATGKVVATASVPDEYVLRSGDTMTGPLVLSGNPTDALQASTKEYVDNKAAASGQTFAAGSTTNNGSTLAYGLNFASVRKTGDGEFQIYFIAPASSSDYVVSVTPGNRNRIFRVFEQGPLSFKIGFQNLTGEWGDTPFSFSVLGPFSDVRVPKSERV